MLQDAKIVVFLSSKDLNRSRIFYEDLLGLNYLGKDDFALIFQLPEVLLRINYLPEESPKDYTALGWIVDDILVKISYLNKNGVVMEKYENMGQDEKRITTLPDGTKLAYFKDPDENVLSLTEFSK